MCALASGTADGRELFVSVFTVGDQGEQRGVSRLVDFAELFDDESLRQLFDGYTPDSSVLAAVDLRGVPAIIRYDADSTTLDFVVPQVFAVNFQGETRDDAQEKFEDFLKGESEVGGISIKPLLQELVAHSPVDPVAGNPNSLQTRMFVDDFALATRPWITAEDWRSSDNYFLFDMGGGTGEGQTGLGDIDVQVADVALGYQMNFGGGKYGLNFDFPFTYTSAEGGDSYFASLGLAFQYRPTSWWTVQPAARFGAAGSIDVGALAAIYAGTVTNYLTYAFDNGIGVGWGIEGGIANTVDGIEIGDFNLEYDLTNTVLRNGLNLNGPFGLSLLGQSLGWRAFVTDTRFYGDDLFLDQYNEVGAAVDLLGRDGAVPADWLSLRGSYLFGDDYDGFRADLRFTF